MCSDGKVSNQGTQTSTWSVVPVRNPMDCPAPSRSILVFADRRDEVLYTQADTDDGSYDEVAELYSDVFQDIRVRADGGHG